MRHSIYFVVLISSIVMTACGDDDHNVDDDSYYEYTDDECHTCGHSNKSGGYCERTVCDDHLYCWQHR